MLDLEKILSKNDKVELERLDKYGEFLNGISDISDAGTVISEFALAGVLVYSLYFESIPIVDKIVIGAFAFYFPWAVWVIKSLGININISISNILLIVSGIVVGTRFICLVLDYLIDRANMEVDEILSKYNKEEN